MNLSDPIRSVSTTLEGKALRVLAHSTEPLTGASVARIAGAGSAPGMRLALARLVSDGTVQTRRVGAADTYTANRRHIMWPVIESVVYAADMALSRVEAVVIESLGESIGDPIQAAQVSISLFGSVARGDSTLESDVDLLIVFPTTFADDLVQNAIDGVSVAVTQSTGNPCNIYAATSERFTQLVTSGDAMVSSWDREARTFHGPDVRRMIRDARGNV